jgi:hypothetical protein
VPALSRCSDLTRQRQHALEEVPANFAIVRDIRAFHEATANRAWVATTVRGKPILSFELREQKRY